MQSSQAIFGKLVFGKHYRRLVMSLLVTIFVCGALIFAVRDSHPQESETLPLTGVERITLKQYGFEPRQITRRQGLFLLAVDNRSGLGAISLRLEQTNGGLARQIDIYASSPDWRDTLNLPAGDYVLTVTGNPQWRCNITITPN